ncbi:MAG: UMP kinase [Pseudomonadota bacterium]
MRLSKVLLKISGEWLMGDNGENFDAKRIHTIARTIAEVHDGTLDLCLVIGGGNLMRGAVAARNLNLARDVADRMGMLATVMNALCLQDALEKCGKQTRLLSGFEMPKLCEPYIGRRAKRHLEKGRIVIFAGGLGETHFSTDTTAAQRAAEMQCQALLKATNVDGVYDRDPNRDPNARRYQKLSFHHAMNLNDQVLDHSAFGLCASNAIRILVFSLHDPDALKGAINGTGRFTTVSDDAEIVFDE